MTGRIIPLPGSAHREVQALLPWHITGQLDPAERARVDDHLATCEDCRAQLGIERTIQREIGREPADVEQGWAALRRQLGEAGAGASHTPASLPQRRPRWLAYGMAAQVALLGVFGAMAYGDREPRYHALGTATAPASGNVVVIFRPETSERELRQVLRMSGARLVDGPTIADGYVLHVAPADRAAALASLRRAPQIMLAEPIGGRASP